MLLYTSPQPIKSLKDQERQNICRDFNGMSYVFAEEQEPFPLRRIYVSICSFLQRNKKDKILKDI